MPGAAEWQSRRASPVKCVPGAAGVKICVVGGGNPPERMEVLLTMSGITPRWRGVLPLHGTIGTVSTHQVPLVARRHIDLKRVCSACCLPY
ncbi:Uncharacterised protein [Mycobacteroides abscessus subsp. abscessus]|nr:Uncharacterised protein [Mycobacteroides abscessus subsp. abscessus]